jgi:50S ribosomal protein L16 3-hydroxylase
MQLLAGLSRSDFLKHHWQKKPLLIRQAIPNYQSPISPEELAGLACEDDVESRLVLEHGEDGPWQLRHGPFAEEDFLSLPKSHWSLLVQAVDVHIPEVSRLLDEFDFIPNWRIDDVMVSYAPVHGSVGPHLDSYDVFLLQAQGQRHWHINEECYTEDDFIDGLELRILEDFKSQEDWILEPGDMLYLPPGVAHHGIALDDCLTYSIGFRAPSQRELLSAFTHHFDEVAKDSYYTDPGLALQESSGEIKAEHIRAIRDLMLSSVPNEAAFASWFGRFITENPDDRDEHDAEELNMDDFHIQLKQSDHLNRYGNIRMSYIEDKESIGFFFAGNELRLPASQLPLIRYLCTHHRIDYHTIMELGEEASALDLLFKLHREGCFFFDE